MEYVSTNWAILAHLNDRLFPGPWRRAGTTAHLNDRRRRHIQLSEFNIDCNGDAQVQRQGCSHHQQPGGGDATRARPVRKVRNLCPRLRGQVRQPHPPEAAHPGGFWQREQTTAGRVPQRRHAGQGGRPDDLQPGEPAAPQDGRAARAGAA